MNGPFIRILQHFLLASPDERGKNSRNTFVWWRL